MQKKLIALAVAGLASTGAFAQSNVTVYGVADAYVGSFKTDNMERSTQVNSGGLGASRIGFKGVEDLGNGLKALFVMEYKIDLDQNGGIGSNFSSGAQTANGSGPARQQMVGLTGGFGTAVAGRLQTAGYDWQQKVDVLGGTAIDPLGNVGAGDRFLIGSTSAFLRRGDNAIAYISPSFGGVTVALNRAYAAEESGAKDLNKNTIANLISVSYEAGPLYVGGVYANAKGEGVNGSNVAIDTVDQREWALGAAYDFKVVKVNASYQSNKNKLAVGALDAQNTAWNIGAAVPVSAAGTIVASYAQAKLKQVAVDENKIKSWTLAYTHALSKRTTAYAGYTQINRDDAISAGTYTPVGTTVAATNFGADTTAFVAGVNHKF